MLPKACRAALLILLPLAALLTGCSNVHQTRVQEATDRWGQMRAKIKLQLAEKTYESGSTDEAWKVCQEAIGLDDTSTDAYLLMARIEMELGQNAAAAAALDKASQHGCTVPDLHYLRGLLAERRGDLEAAAESYRQAYAAAGQECDYLLAYAGTMLSLEQVGDILPVLESRRGDFEQQPAFHMLLGQACAQAGRFGPAADAYLSALALAPGSMELREETALALIAANRLTEARAVISASPLEGPGASAPLLRSLASALIADNQTQVAVELLEPAVAAHPEVPGLWATLARAYLALDANEKAGRALDKALALAPDSTEACLLAAYRALVTGNKPQAERLAKQVIERNPEDEQAVAILAAIER